MELAVQEDRGKSQQCSTTASPLYKAKLDEEEAHTSAEGPRPRLSAWVKFAYAAPGFATTSLSFLIAVYINDFYSALGVPLPFLSFFTALARSFDVLTDPLMGWWSDSTRTKYGRRRPYIASGCLFYCILFVLLFTPPAQDESDPAEGENEAPANLKAAYWFGFFYILFYFSDTYCNVPYEALGPELSDDYEERNELFFEAKIFNFVGMMFAAALPSFLTSWMRAATEAPFPCLRLYAKQSDVQEEEDGSSGNVFHDSHVQAPQYCTSIEVEDDALAGEGSRDEVTDGSGDETDEEALIDYVTLNATACEGEFGRYCFLMRGDGGGEQYMEIKLEQMDKICLPEAQDGCTAESKNRTCTCGWEEDGREEGHNTVPFSRYDVSYVDAQRLSFTIVAVIFGVYFVVSQLNCVASVQERQHMARTADDGPKTVTPLVPSIMRSFKNIAFRPLLAAWALDGLGVSALFAMFPFFIRYVVVTDNSGMDPLEVMGLSAVGLLITACISSPVWLQLSTRFGKYHTWLFFNLINAITNLLFFIPAEGDPKQTIMVMVLNGIPVGGQFLTNSILADVIDYDEFLNGVRNEGAFSVYATLIPKFVAIPASALPLAIVNALGFSPPVDGVAQPQTDEVKLFVRFCFILLPFTCSIIGFCIKILFPIKTKSSAESITEGIKLHRQGLPAVDPITGHEVVLMTLTDEEEKTLWIYENFSAKMLQKLTEQGTAPVVLEMQNLFYQGVALNLFTIAIVVFSFPAIHHPKLSIIPIMGVISFGASVSFLVVNYMRLNDAKALEAVDLEKHVDLINRLRQQKESGSRAGDASATSIELSRDEVMSRNARASAAFTLPPMAAAAAGLDPRGSHIETNCNPLYDEGGELVRGSSIAEEVEDEEAAEAGTGEAAPPPPPPPPPPAPPAPAEAEEKEQPPQDEDKGE